MTRVLIIDNYDSFVYNIAQYMGEMGATVAVRRNDVTLEEAMKTLPERIVLSPGPGHPRDSGATLDVIREFGGKIPILGVCLGHQAIGYHFGSEIASAGKLLHGKTGVIHHDARGIFRNVASPMRATRYHSLIISEKNLPEKLMVTARTKSGEIMAIRHEKFPLYGVQFHPESILTEDGKIILRNFLEGG